MAPGNTCCREGEDFTTSHSTLDIVWDVSSYLSRAVLYPQVKNKTSFIVSSVYFVAAPICYATGLPFAVKMF
jgi:hypothetical protein